MRPPNPMPKIPPPPPLNLSGTNPNPDVESVRNLVAVINHHMHAALQDAQSLKLKCFSKLRIRSQKEFFEHSVLSNLYWGIENAEAELEDSEKMLQIPASLDENGVTLGIPNTCFICCSYFYLSVVEFLRRNQWQAAVHFLEAVSVSPRLVWADFAPGIWESFYSVFLGESFDRAVDDGMVDDVMRWIARRYKPWLLYYQIMSTRDSSTMVERSRSIECRSSYEKRNGLRTYSSPEKMHCPSFEANEVSVNTCIPTLGKQKKLETKSSNIKCLKDMLTESEPDSPVSLHTDRGTSSVEQIFPQKYEEDHRAEVNNQSALLSRNSRAFPSKSKREHRKIKETKAIEGISCSFSTSSSDTNITTLAQRTLDQYTQFDQYKTLSRMPESLSCRASSFPEDNQFIEQLISKLCFSDEAKTDEDYTVEMKTIYETLNAKSGLKYSLLKDMILDQLLVAISSSREDNVVRTSVAILSTIITSNRSVAEDIKRKGLQLYDLATALKRNVHEVVILIYLINPSPLEIKTLELLPSLVEVICTSKIEFSSLLLTPPSASLMIIEVLVTAFDYETNSMHLASISSPRVLSGLLQVPRKDNLDEFVSLASVLVKCMRFDGKCRKYIAEFSPVSPFVFLLWSNQKRATCTALEFFNELLRMPRSSAVTLLEQIKKQGSINNMCALFLLTQNSEAEYKLLAANLLLQLEVLEDASSKCMYKEEAAEALLRSLTLEESAHTQAIASFILSNLGGTYSWTGESYTMPWLLKKTGLTLPHHRNLIRTCDLLHQTLQDGGVDSWSSRIGQRMLQLGTRVFESLEKGVKSKSKRVWRDSLVAAAWLGWELAKGPGELRHEACEILLHTVQQFVHPGFELEDRLLACFCIYNYTSGRGMKKIINLSEGVRESLRRLSNVTWMAEELLKVADYFQPNKWRISCVHSQVLEAGNKYSGAVTALIYYKGLLHSGFADGSIKAWEIKGQTATLVHETREHKKAVTCFALYEPGNSLLSGSADKTIKMWQLLQRNLECIEVIPMKDSVKSIDSWGEFIFPTTQSHKLKVIDGSRKAKDVFKNKRVKCVKVSQGKVYAGCMDSSIQEWTITNNRKQEMKAPSKSWIQNKPISAISIYKEWLYCASSVLEGSKMKDWRKNIGAQVSVVTDKGASIVAMEVVEDFVYLNCTTSMSSLQIWLRGTTHRVGRLSAGSKITSLLTANDMILCGTEKGVIKGWIPL